ncbi:MAG: cytidine deaminase [Acetobacteraceae bacterium]|nr:cytidine deaminase [Acetobacteraceae bacterium]
MDTLLPADQALARHALTASANAYAQYSGFAVGAAARMRNGAIHLGANLENASYGVAMCAEVSAITAANTSGSLDLEAIAVVGHRFTPPIVADQVVTPCGRCRQLIFEASQISGVDIRVISCSADLEQIDVSPISILLPSAFGPRAIGLDQDWIGMRATLAERVRVLQAQLVQKD